MNRWGWLSLALAYYLLDVGEAMLDGSYWRETRDDEIGFCGEGRIGPGGVG